MEERLGEFHWAEAQGGQAARVTTDEDFVHELESAAAQRPSVHGACVPDKPPQLWRKAGGDSMTAPYSG